VCDRAPGVPPPQPATPQGEGHTDDAESDASGAELELEPPYQTQLRLTQQFFDLLDSEGGDEDPQLQYERRAKFYYHTAMAAYRCAPLAEAQPEPEPAATPEVGD
jgi:hypothetical protein